MRRRIRELAAWILTLCIVCGGIWTGVCTVYAAEVQNIYTLVWKDISKSKVEGNAYSQNTYREDKLKEGDLLTYLDTPTKEGYVYLGWAGYEGSESGYESYFDSPVNPISSKEEFDAKNYTMKSQNCGIYLNWAAIRYIISFDGNGADSGTPEEEYGSLVPTWDDEKGEYDYTEIIYYNDEISLPSEQPVRTGYVFDGWEYDGTTYEPGGTFTVPDVEPMYLEPGGIYAGDITLTASWSPNMHTVTYNGNGATAGTPASQSAGYETTVTVGAAPTREGYTFTGWLSSDGQTYQPGAAFTMPDGDVTLTAQWTVANTGGISAAGSYYLLKGQAYRLNGVTGTGGEAGSYASGVTFYVPSDGYYTFKE